MYKALQDFRRLQRTHLQLQSKFLSVFLISIFFLAFSFNSNGQINAVAGIVGNWSAPSSWVGGVVPGNGASIVIPATTTISVDINTATVNNVTINGGILQTLNTATSTLTYSGNLVINNNGALLNDGGVVQITNGRAFTLNNTATYRHNPRNNTSLDESIFTRSNETFSTTSNLIIQKWFDLSVPLGGPTKVQSAGFGNVTLSVVDTIPWEQNGYFNLNTAAYRIHGTLTVTAGTISMDNGTGSPSHTELFLNDVVINGTGRIIFCSGPSRPYTLFMADFTDVSTNPKPTIIADNMFHLATVWTVNGDATIGHNFMGLVGTGVNPGGFLTVQISGNLNITGGDVRFVSQAHAPLTLSVTGNTTISGTPTAVRFLDGNAGNLNYSTNNLTISGGGNNVFMGGNGLLPPATGVPNFVINNNLVINGVSNTTVLDAATSVQKLRLRVGNSMTIAGTNANFTVANHKGPLTVAVTNNLDHTAGKYIGQIDSMNTAIDSMIVGGIHTTNCLPASSDYFRINYGDGNTFYRCAGAFVFTNSGTGNGIGFSGIYGGRGNMHFQVLGNFTMSAGRFAGITGTRPNVETGNMTFITGVNYLMSGGFFRGIDSRLLANPGTITFTAGNLTFNGGNFKGYYSSHNNNGIANFNINGLLQLTFTNAATDSFAFVGYTTIGGITSSLRLAVTVTGNFNITGQDGKFISSLANGRETFNVTGEMNVSGGKNSFDSYPLSGLANSHPVIITIGSHLAVNGGSLYFSANNDSVSVTVNGNMSVTNGEVVLQGGNTPAELFVKGGYTQNGGTFFLHKNPSELSYSSIVATINSDGDASGDFSHTGGTINFDNNTTSISATLEILSPNVTYGGTGIMTMANPGTNTITGIIKYARNGNINFNRTSLTHSIQQVEQHIETGCTLTVMTGNLQIASLNNITTNMLFIATGATLDLKGSQVFSNALQANSGFKCSGRIRTTRPQGFYDGTANAAINANGDMNYFLLSNSTVEYYGSDNQVITGIGVGNATSIPHKYYNLEINFSGTPDVEFVYPTNLPNTRSVFVRNKLILTNGELNLDNDHDPVSGGRSIFVERDSVTAITRTNGYIRSEVYDSTASVIWKIGSYAGAHVFPFGYNSTQYIPFTFNLPAGNTADTVIVSTYHTPTNNNIPYPPGVPNVNSLTGTDNSLYTVDRFWYLEVTGNTPTAHLSFVCTPAERVGITDPRAQAWIPTNPPGWQYPIQGNQSTLPSGTLVQNATYFPLNWWTLAGLANPLPVTLLDLTADCNESSADIKWATASEINNHFFTVLRSVDGISYEPIENIPGNNNSNTVIYYSFTDKNPPAVVAYYKLRQTDYDGKFEEFGPIVLRPCSTSSAFDVSIIPTSPEQLNVIIQSPEDDRYRISIFSMEGKPLTQSDHSLTSGVNVVTINTSRLAAAVYFIRIQGSQNAITRKIPLGFSK